MKSEIVDLNQFTIHEYIESKKPKNLEIRKMLNYSYSYEAKIFELFAIRPAWSNPIEIQHYPFAKIKFMKTTQLWNLYWKRASGKWELYKPYPTSTKLKKIIEIIDEDKLGCFYG